MPALQLPKHKVKYRRTEPNSCDHDQSLASWSHHPCTATPRGAQPANPAPGCISSSILCQLPLSRRQLSDHPVPFSNHGPKPRSLCPSPPPAAGQHRELSKSHHLPAEKCRSPRSTPCLEMHSYQISGSGKQRLLPLFLQTQPTPLFFSRRHHVCSVSLGQNHAFTTQIKFTPFLPFPRALGQSPAALTADTEAVHWATREPSEIPEIK